MGSDHRNDEEAIFYGALELGSPTARAAYVTEACGNDRDLLERIRALLRADGMEDGFLEDPPTILDVPTPNSLLTEAPGTVIGRYKLLEKIGEGGMAVVYMAEQTEPIRRKVALKIIKLGMDTRQVIARFEAERQALALMDHPGIAKVLDGGATETGRPYFAMELVQGVSITEYCDKNSLSTKDRLNLFLQVCHAVQHAHTKGIIHRDIKPSNVMVTHHDGKPVPKVIDFGIAKATNQKLTEKTLFTRYAHLIGTPAYMSPEQAELSDLDIDTRSDIYSLGVLLYELLTGTTPFSEEDLRKAGYIEMQRVIREQEPVKPSTRLSTLGETLTDIAKCRNCTPDLLRKSICGDLDWIVMKSLEKDRVRRYETASSLGEDIRRHLGSEPVLACPPSPLYRFHSLLRRNKGVFAAVGAVAAVLLLGVVVSVWQAVRATQAERAETRLREEAEMTRAEAIVQRRKAEALAYASDVSMAQQALTTEHFGRVRQLLDAHRPARDEPDLRGWEWRYLWQQCRSSALIELCRHERVFSVSYSPDGKLLAVGGYVPDFVEIWDVAGQRRLRLLQEGGGRRVAFSPRGALLATEANDQICLWRTDTWERVQELDTGASPVGFFKFSPDGRRLACLSYAKTKGAMVWEIGQESGRWSEIRTIPRVMPGDYNTGSLDFSPDGRALVIGDANGRLLAVDLAREKPIFDRLNARPPYTTGVAWSPDGSVIASVNGYERDPIRLWDCGSGRPLGELKGHTAWIAKLVFSADGAWLYSAGGDQTIRIWDVKKQQLRDVLRGHQHEVFGLALAPDGGTLASAGRDGIVALWNARPDPRKDQPRVVELGNQRLGFAFAPNSRVLAVARQGTVSLLDLSTLEEIEQIPALGKDVSRVAYSPDGTLLASAGLKERVRVWSCAERRRLRELGNSSRLLHFGADGRSLLSVDAEGQATSWDTATWQPLRTFTVSIGDEWREAVSPDVRLLAVNRPEPGVRWLDAETGQLLPATGDAQPWCHVAGIAFSPDGKQAASSALDGFLTLWDLSSLQAIDRFRAHLQAAQGVAFSPDGRRLATGGGGDNAVKLWDLSTCRELVTLPGRGSLFQIVAFSPDGRWLAACNRDGNLHLWHAPSWEEIEAAERNPKNVPSPR